MSHSNSVLAEPLTLAEEIPRGAWLSGKIVVLSSFIVGLVLAVLVSPLRLARSEEPAVSLFGAELAKTSPMSMSCPRPGMAMSVSAMQDSLKKYNIPSSPMTKFALTTLAATRDPAMESQAREEFLRLDPVTQSKFKNLAKDVVVKASTLKAEDMAGATAPLGFWDPLGYSKVWDLASLRAVELKHGRVCMLATLGMIVSEKFHPIFDGWGDGAFVSAAASHFTPTASLNFWPAFVTMIGGLDLFLDLSQPEDAAPGDFGFDPLGLKPKGARDLLELQNKELNNGRLAMFAAAGILAQELVTGKKIF
jgi:hypothetical protein